MDSLVDVARDACRRWLTLGRNRHCSDHFERCPALPRAGGGRQRSHGGHSDFSQDQARSWPGAASRYRAALLGAHRDPRQIFVSFGALDHGFCRCCVAGVFLSGSPAVAADTGGECRGFTGGRRNAFSERRIGGLRNGGAAGIRRFQARHLSGARHMSWAVQVRSVQGGGFHSVKTESPVPARFQAL
jgi:hypothetical protein